MFYITVSATTTETGEPIAVPYQLFVVFAFYTESTSKLGRGWAVFIANNITA